VTRLAPGVVTALTLLVFAPPLESAFHVPKLVVLALGLVALTPHVFRAWRRLPVPALVFLAAVSASATWNDAWSAPSTTVLLLGASTLAAWHLLDVDEEATVRVVGAALLVVCALVVLQGFGVATFGASGRMARSATLGNPDFVASAVAPLAVACLGVARRASWKVSAPAGALVALALAFTQSFATVTSLGAGLLFLLAHPSMQGSRRWLLAGAVVVGAVLLVGLAGRDVATSAQGRWYLASVVAPHVIDAPLIGLGPGAVELHWPRWELELWTRRCGEDAGCVARHPDFQFTGLEAHAHDDWLEVWLEAGPLALGALLALVVARLRDAWRSAAPFAGAALVVIAARALVDFPLHRPADWAVLALVCALARPRADRPVADARRADSLKSRHD
jgi:O-antigen ligase